MDRGLDLPPVLTLKEVASFLRLSGSHVRELAASGQLASIQAGSRKARRVLRDDLLAFIESRRSKAQPARSVSAGELTFQEHGKSEQ